MKVFALLLTLLFSAWILLDCRNNDSQSRPSEDLESDTVQYTSRTFDRSYGACDSSGKDCLSILLQYPIFQSSSASPFPVDSLNTVIHNLILNPLFVGSHPQTPLQLYEDLVNEYQKLLAEFPDQWLVWDLIREIRVLWNTPGILSIQFQEYLYSGGAHPNQTILLYSFDLSTGHVIKLGDILKENTISLLDSLAEIEFRRVRKLNLADDLNQKGFWFPQNMFRVPDNFMLDGVGIYFYFNRYEIAPYAVGPTELHLPYDQVASLLSPFYHTLLIGR